MKAKLTHEPKDTEVIIVDIDIPTWSLVILIWKWFVACLIIAVAALPVVILVTFYLNSLDG